MAEEKDSLSVLWIDLKGSDLSQIKQGLLKEAAHPAHFDSIHTFQEAFERLKKNNYHVILADSHSALPIESLEKFLTELKKLNLKVPFILLVEPGEEKAGEKAIQWGAADFYVKPHEEISELTHRLWTTYWDYQLRQAEIVLNQEIESDHQNLGEVSRQFQKFTIRDELTHLYNHRYFQERLIEEYNRALRYGHSLSCLLVDLDRFRRINETLGHAAGDEILKEAADLLLESCRTSDLIGRFGGEEFAILLPHIDYPGANETAERLRETFAQHSFLSNSQRVSLTISIGIASFPADIVKQRSDLLNFADQALFRAKAAGRNCVLLYRDILPAIGETLPELRISEERVMEFQKRLAEVADGARRGHIDSTKTFMAALESKDHLTAGHAGNTARLVLQVAEAMGLPLDEAEVVEHAGLLHDIGKICISDEILLKPARFTLGEYEAMKQHPYFGYRIVKPIKFLREEATLILHHHEWFNGEGYPCRLGGKEIPLGARIIAVVDSYDTMHVTGGRYKEIKSAEEAVGELIRCSGKQFDPEVVQTFIQVLLNRKELNPDGYDRKLLHEILEAQRQNPLGKI